MSQIVYGIMVDLGDGSATIRWYRNTPKENLIEKMDEDPDLYWMNEGSISQTLTFPADLDLSTIGFHFND